LTVWYRAYRSLKNPRESAEIFYYLSYGLICKTVSSSDEKTVAKFWADVPENGPGFKARSDNKKIVLSGFSKYAMLQFHGSTRAAVLMYLQK
jgi:hypothetical protein